MDELGNLLGTLTGIGFTLALLNYPVKWINKRWISSLPKQSALKKYYTLIMQVLVKYHRFFGLGAAASLLTHLLLQINFKWISTTGLIAAVLLGANVALGAFGHFKQKRKRGPWLYVHRFVTLALLGAILVHTNLRF